MTLWHITTRSAWDAALEEGCYRAPSLQTEGFIHLSTSAQWRTTATRFYRGQADLVRLAIDESLLDAPVRFEPPAHPGPVDGEEAREGTGAGELFPHLYGALTTGAVTAVIDLIPGPDGGFGSSGEPASTP